MLGHVCLAFDKFGEWVGVVVGLVGPRGSRPIGLVQEIGPVNGFRVSWEFGFGVTDLGGKLGKGQAYGICA